MQKIKDFFKSVGEKLLNLYEKVCDIVKNGTKKQRIIFFSISAAALVLVVTLVVVICIAVGSNNRQNGEEANSAINSIAEEIRSEAENDPATGVNEENVNKVIISETDDVTEAIGSDSYPYITEKDGLTILSLEKYSGYFVEDGSNTATKDALAAKFYNTTGKDIHYARIEMTSDKSAVKAVFEMSFVMNDEVIYVQERYNRKFIEGETLTVSNVMISFIDEEIYNKNVSELINMGYEKRSDGNGAIIYNKTDSPLYGNIYYKQKSAGILYGGIAYRIALPYAISDDTSMHIRAVHFNETSVPVAFEPIADNDDE